MDRVINNQLEKIKHWDFSKHVHPILRTGCVLIDAIPLSPVKGKLINDALLKSIVKSNKDKGSDLLENDSYPIFDVDSGLLLCGNRYVAYALVCSGYMQLSSKEMIFPFYFTPIKFPYMN